VHVIEMVYKLKSIPPQSRPIANMFFWKSVDNCK
jgi:hypothetical protein